MSKSNGTGRDGDKPVVIHIIVTGGGSSGGSSGSGSSGGKDGKGSK